MRFPMGEKVITEKPAQDYSKEDDQQNDKTANVDDEEGEDQDDDNEEGDENHGPGNVDRVPSSDAPPIPGGMDEASALAIFSDYRQFGS